MAEYANDAYLASLGAARGDIDRQYQNTLSEVARQQTVNKGQAAQIPGAVSRVADAAAQQATGVGQRMLGALQDLQLHKYADFGAPQVQGAIENTQSRLGQMTESYNRAAGLIGQGFDEQAQQRQAQASMIQRQLLADNAQTAAGYQATLQREAANQAFAREMIAQQSANQDSLAQTALDNQLALLARSSGIERERMISDIAAQLTASGATLDGAGLRQLKSVIPDLTLGQMASLAGTDVFGLGRIMGTSAPAPMQPSSWGSTGLANIFRGR